MKLEREQLFQLLAKQDWDQIAKILYRNIKELRGSVDPIVQQAIGYFEAEFFAFTRDLDPKEKIKKFEYPSLIIELNQHGFSSSFVNRFIDERLALLQELNSSILLDYAKSHQNRPLAKKIIQDFHAKKPEQVAALRREHHFIRSTEVIDAIDSKTIKLFKSKQEENFFEAVRRAFPTYHPYPNVALSCILDFAAIGEVLNKEQREYFFRGIVDAVVFDSSRGYEPRYFIELDSSFHDTERASRNDEMKDAIFRAANTKLIRIRPLNAQAASVEELEKLVLEVMRYA